MSIISGAKLPSIRQVLKLFLYHHKAKTIRDRARSVSEEVLKFWEIAKILTKKLKHVVTKVEKDYKQYLNLKKNCSPNTETQKSHEKLFLKQLIICGI